MSKADELKALVPESLSQIREFGMLYDTQGLELDDVYYAVNDVLDQCFVSSATWGLKFWEAVLGIPVDESKETAFRRDVVLSKIRGSGTVTVQMIDTTLESYSNSEINIVEHNDASAFEVVFVSTKGIPPNLPDLQNAIEELKPAHLAVIYTFRYNTYRFLEQFTHAQLSAYSHNYLREVI